MVASRAMRRRERSGDRATTRAAGAVASAAIALLVGSAWGCGEDGSAAERGAAAAEGVGAGPAGSTGGGQGGDAASGGAPSAGGAAVGAASAGGGGPLVAIATTCVGAEEPTYQPYTNEVPQVPICEDPDRLPLPQQAHLVDLSQTASGDPGTCGPFLAAMREPPAIEASLGFPQVLRLPALLGADAGCASLCDLGPETTAFGLTVVYLGLPRDVLLTIRVPSPWFLVIGDEHSPTPCMDGRPSVLEYGKPLACATTWGNHIGFATADPGAPSVDVLVDAIDPRALPTTPVCCPYTCP
jgi:hypothetical protein